MKSIRFFKNGVLIPVELPQTIPATNEASSTLTPLHSYDMMNLFDFRTEHAWASNHLQRDVSLKFHFTEEQQITGLKIWNGYQLSEPHFQSNARVKRLRVQGDNNFLEIVPVSNQMGSQYVTFEKPFKGRKFELIVIDSFPGKKYPDLVISELRFMNDRKVLTLDSSPHFKRIVEHNKQSFEFVDVIDFLDIIQATNNESWRFNFESNGGFSIEGNSDFIKDSSVGSFNFYTAFGSYEVLSASNKTLKLKLMGHIEDVREANLPDDHCHGCMPKKGPKEVSPETWNANEITKKVFQESIEIKSIGPGKFEISNLSPSSTKVMEFSKLRVSRLRFEK